jgi:hypothetical protein
MECIRCGYGDKFKLGLDEQHTHLEWGALCCYCVAELDEEKAVAAAREAEERLKLEAVTHTSTHFDLRDYRQSLVDQAWERKT